MHIWYQNMLYKLNNIVFRHKQYYDGLYDIILKRIMNK